MKLSFVQSLRSPRSPSDGIMPGWQPVWAVATCKAIPMPKPIAQEQVSGVPGNVRPAAFWMDLITPLTARG